MRVLYVAKHPNALSETYVCTEARWVQAQGVEVAVHAPEPYEGVRTTTPLDFLPTATLRQAVEQFRPDVVHCHWFTVAAEVAPTARELGLPVTVRGHSFDVRFMDRAMSLVDLAWVFPHQVPPDVILYSARVRPMPCCHDSRVFHPGPELDEDGFRHRRVFRAAAGLPGKGLEEFVEVARRCPDIDFVLAVTRTPWVDAFLDAVSLPANLTVLTDVEELMVARLMRTAPLYFRGHDPSSHPYGMPVSIAEAMACGAHVLYRDDPAARAFVGGAGTAYVDVEGAAAAVTDFFSGNKTFERRQADRRVSVARSRQFEVDAVLPALIAGWEELVGRGA